MYLFDFSFPFVLNGKFKLSKKPVEYHVRIYFFPCISIKLCECLKAQSLQILNQFMHIFEGHNMYVST